MRKEESLRRDRTPRGHRSYRLLRKAGELCWAVAILSTVPLAVGLVETLRDGKVSGSLFVGGLLAFVAFASLGAVFQRRAAHYRVR
jgi:hypothetical protein